MARAPQKPFLIQTLRPGFGLDTSGVARKARFAVSAKEDRTIDGETFDSKKEAARYCQLKLLQKAGLIESLDLQPAWAVEINGKHFCRYTADFSYFCKERGRLIIEDVKSSGTAKDAAYRLRKKAAELAHGIKITEVLA
jgi:Protein of unknown function (DUF1064)